MRGVLTGFVIVLALGGCSGSLGRFTGAGTPTSSAADAGSIHFGPPLPLHLCVLKSTSLSGRRADTFLADVRGELIPYRIPLEVSWIHPWEQPHGGTEAIMADLRNRPLEPPCDRLLALVDRTGAAFVSGLVLPEVGGEADRATATHGYVVLAYTPATSLFRGAESAPLDAFRSLLGCTPDMGLNACEHRIAELKASADPQAGFLPGVAPDGAPLTTRAEVNEALLRAQAGLH